MGISLLSRALDWQDCSWWWYDAADPGPNAYAEFFCDLETSAPVRSAWLGLSADVSYKLWLDGEWLFLGPMREAPPFFYYDVLDLKPFLIPGVHRLRILVHRPGVTYNTHVPAEGGLLVQGEWDAGGKKIALGDPNLWRARPARGYRANAHRLGHCLGFAEHFDFSSADTGWLTRPIPGDAVRPVITATFPKGALQKPLLRDLPGFIGDVFTAQKVAGPVDIQLFDFGQETFGFVTLRFRLQTPTTFHIAYGEHLADGVVNPAKAGMDYQDVLSAPAGEYRWTSYEKRAARFVQLPANVEVMELSIQEYHYPYQRVYSFSSSPLEPGSVTPVAGLAQTGSELAMLDRHILETSARSIEVCSDDLLNDCPWRERSQYLDPWAYFSAMKKLFGTLEPIRKYLLQMLRPVEIGRNFPMCYPSGPQVTLIPDYSCTIPLAVEHYFHLSGDRALAKRCYPAAARALAEYNQYEDEQHLLRNVPGWVFLDNTFELNKFPRSAGLNAIYAAGYRALSRLAELAGRPADAEQHQAHFDQVRAGWRQVFLRSDTILDADSSPTFAQRHFWNYHYPADGGKAANGAFLLKTQIRFPSAGEKTLYLSHFRGCRVWLDGEEVLHAKHGGGWSRPPIFHPTPLSLSSTGEWQNLWLEVEYMREDWEVYLGTDEPLEVAPVEVIERPSFGEVNATQISTLPGRATRWRPFFVPPISQITVGFAAHYGLLNDDEAPRLLKACLSNHYYRSYAKRTTPFFVTQTQDPQLLRTTVMPCNTPASLFTFCAALRKYGLGEEAKNYLRMIYSGMLARGATTWWEEFGTDSSLCHAWGAFVADHLL